MIQVIGLIISVYCVVRLLQVPLETSLKAREPIDLGVPVNRMVTILVLSIVGVLGIALLVMLMLAPQSLPFAPPPR